MEFDIKYRPVNSLAQCRLEEGEELVVEPSAMVGMSTNVEMETGMAGGQHDSGGGMLSKAMGAASRMFTGESFFQNTFRAGGGPGEVLMAHKLTGDINIIEVPETGLTVQSESYIASHPAIELETTMGGFKSMFAGEGFFLIDVRAREPGVPVVVGAFGAIEPMQVDGSLVIDSGHLVAWEGQLQYDAQKVSSGIINTMLSGEGWVCHFEGEGTVWLQTRNPSQFGEAIGGKLPPREQ